MSIPREHRLRKHSEFEQVYQCGRRHFSPLLTAFYLLRESADEDGVARIGITVGRVMGKAIDRNRIKRRVRAAVNENLQLLSRPVDVVINPKKLVRDVDYQQLAAEVAGAFSVISQRAVPAQQRQTPRPARIAAKRTS